MRITAIFLLQIQEKTLFIVFIFVQYIIKKSFYTLLGDYSNGKRLPLDPNILFIQC